MIERHQKSPTTLVTCIYTVFSLRDHYRSKYCVNDRKSAKFIENKCTHCAMRLVLIGNRAQEISDMLDIGLKPSQVVSVVFFYIRNRSKSHRISVPTVRLIKTFPFSCY